MTAIKATLLSALSFFIAGAFCVWTVVAQTPAQTTTAKPATTSTPAPRSAPTSTAAPAGPSYVLSELQRAHLHEAQLAYILASRDLQKAGQDFTQACDQAIAENHWPAGTQCSVQDLSVIPPEKK